MKSFKTSIADVVVDEEQIVYLDFHTCDFPIEKLKAHFVTMHEQLGTEKRMYIYSFKQLSKISISRDARIYNNKKMEGFTESLAVASTNGMLRIFVNLYIKIARFSFPFKILKDTEEAQTWTLKHRSMERVKALRYQEVELKH